MTISLLSSHERIIGPWASAIRQRKVTCMNGNMNGKFDDFARQIETARWRVAGLERHAGEALLPVEALPVAFEELHVAFEELRAAQDELLRQQSELLSTRERVEAERRRYQELFDFAP